MFFPSIWHTHCLLCGIGPEHLTRVFNLPSQVVPSQRQGLVQLELGLVELRELEELVG